jgi:hypothetical protein
MKKCNDSQRKQIEKIKRLIAREQAELRRAKAKLRKLDPRPICEQLADTVRAAWGAKL